MKQETFILIKESDCVLITALIIVLIIVYRAKEKPRFALSSINVN